MALMLRHMVGIERTLAESPTRFKPLLYVPELPTKHTERTPPEGTAWCEGYMSGVKLRDEEWQPLYDAEHARDWIFPIEALAFGEQDDEFTEWVDSDEKREGLIEELAVRGGADLPLLAGSPQRHADDTAPGARRSLIADSSAQIAPAAALTPPVTHRPSSGVRAEAPDQGGGAEAFAASFPSSAVAPRQARGGPVRSGRSTPQRPDVWRSTTQGCLEAVKMWMSGGRRSGLSSVPTRTNLTSGPRRRSCSRPRPGICGQRAMSWPCRCRRRVHELRARRRAARSLDPPRSSR